MKMSTNTEDFKQLINEIADKYGAEEARFVMRKIVNDYFPEEMSEVMNNVIDGKVKPDFNVVVGKITNNVLDSYNNGDRTIEEVEKILGDKKFTREELKTLKMNKE